MNWPWPPLRRGDIMAVLVFIALAAVITIVIVKTAPFSYQASSNAGFGPGWTCTNPGKGGPVCIKDVPVKPSN
jgi:hypothetical protein